MVAAITYAAKIQTVAPVLTPPRAHGVLRLGAKRRGPASVVASLRQEGSLKALFPKCAGDALEAVFLNTAGGLTGGDVMDIAMTAGDGTQIIASSQAAERAYRAQPGQVARAQVDLHVADGARLHWLPQETILFDGAALRRRLHVNLTGNARALIVEPLIFGRAAMGETLGVLHFTDQWRVRRDGKLIFADALRITDDAISKMECRAIAGGAGALATVLLAAPEAGVFAEMPLPDDAGLSLIADDLLLIRILADDGFALRKVLIPVIEALSQAPMPRVWRL